MANKIEDGLDVVHTGQSKAWYACTDPRCSNVKQNKFFVERVKGPDINCDSCCQSMEFIAYVPYAANEEILKKAFDGARKQALKRINERRR